jgi:hypothetical protein
MINETSFHWIDFYGKYQRKRRDSDAEENLMIKMGDGFKRMVCLIN